MYAYAWVWHANSRKIGSACMGMYALAHWGFLGYCLQRRVICHLVACFCSGLAAWKSMPFC